MITAIPDATEVEIGPNKLKGFLARPATAKGLVIFAHGSGSGRLSPRNTYVARSLQAAGFATLLLDLLTPAEEQDRANVFDIALLAMRLAEAADWAVEHDGFELLPIGYFGASTGAGAALTAAAWTDGRIRAVVSRGGRPDLAQGYLAKVKAPTLLLVGSLDREVLELNRWAMAQMQCVKELKVIPGASHLFEEPGTLDIVVSEAVRWFDLHFSEYSRTDATLPFADRRAAGRALAARLAHMKTDQPLVLALPRGGVPVGFEIAQSLGCDLDLLLVRKLGAPGNPEVGIGAIIDGDHPEIVLNQEILRSFELPPGYLHNEAHRQLAELERRRHAYLGGRAAMPVEGRTIIVVDDGIATGGTVRAALRGLRKKAPRRLVLAIPVAPADVLESLRSECDEVICLAAPTPFRAVGVHYHDFGQTTDAEVTRLLAWAARGLETA